MANEMIFSETPFAPLNEVQFESKEVSNYSLNLGQEDYHTESNIEQEMRKLASKTKSLSQINQIYQINSRNWDISKSKISFECRSLHDKYMTIIGKNILEINTIKGLHISERYELKILVNSTKQ